MAEIVNMHEILNKQTYVRKYERLWLWGARENLLKKKSNSLRFFRDVLLKSTYTVHTCELGNRCVHMNIYIHVTGVEDRELCWYM